MGRILKIKSMIVRSKELTKEPTRTVQDTIQLYWILRIWMPDTYTIFIIEKDFYGKGEPVYIIERVNLTTGKSFEDGEHILYVNGEYRGESEIGKLMHDFNCTKADDMNFGLIAERTRYLKENPKGVQEMCKVMEDMRNEVALVERKEIVRTFF